MVIIIDGGFNQRFESLSKTVRLVLNASAVPFGDNFSLDCVVRKSAGETRSVCGNFDSSVGTTDQIYTIIYCRAVIRQSDSYFTYTTKL